MAISIDKHLGIHQYALQLRSERAGVLANNLANADTPGYQARDIDFGAVLKSQMGDNTGMVPMQATSAGHQQGLLQSDAVNGLKYRLPSQPSIDGNTVDADKEKTEFARNTMEFQAAFEFLNGKIKSLLSAIRGE
ncbi:MAG: flagellar basal body rod protein FlgB [Pseudomonadota bacterium]